MSERKTTEIKLRVTPDEKTRWQTEAEKGGVGLSELIRQTMNGLIQNNELMDHKERWEIVVNPGNLIYQPHTLDPPSGPVEYVPPTIPTPVVSHVYVEKGLGSGYVKVEDTIFDTKSETPQEDVPTSDESETHAVTRDVIGTLSAYPGSPVYAPQEDEDKPLYGALRSEKQKPKPWMFKGGASQ